MTVAQEYMRNSALVKESGNRLLEFLETLPNWPEPMPEGQKSVPDDRVRNEKTFRR
jgi:hypothetical protein